MNTHSKESPVQGPDAPVRVSPWRFPLFLAIVLVAMLLWNRNELNPPPADQVPQAESWIPSPLPEGETVGLEIDFGNGASRSYEALPWHEGMTVEDVLEAARSFRPGITFAKMGEGTSGFLTELAGLKNQGASGGNWRYEVAGRPGTQSFCLEKVAPGELVRWTFAANDEDR